MWTTENRGRYDRCGLRYPSDLTDAEWSVLEPFLPSALPGGRPRKWPTRRLVEAMLDALRGGLPWRMLRSAGLPGTNSQHFEMQPIMPVNGNPKSCAGRATVGEGGDCGVAGSGGDPALSSRPLAACVSSPARFHHRPFRAAMGRTSGKNPGR